MSLWDPVLDGASKYETFIQRIVREVYQVGCRRRLSIVAEFRALVREGRVDAAMEEARTSSLTPGSSLGAIATEQARLSDVAGALATVRMVEEPEARAGIMVENAEVCAWSSEPVAAEVALTEATTATKKIRGEAWRHWHARRFAEIGMARFRLGQHEAARRACRLAFSVADGQRDETRNQTLGDVVRASCLAEDTETAAAAIQHMSPGGCRDRAIGRLAGAEDFRLGTTSFTTNSLAQSESARSSWLKSKFKLSWTLNALIAAVHQPIDAASQVFQDQEEDGNDNKYEYGGKRKTERDGYCHRD